MAKRHRENPKSSSTRPIRRLSARRSPPLESAYWQHVAQLTRSVRCLAVDVEWLYNPEGRTAWTIVPGLAGVVVMISMLMLGALTLVRERELGSWETLLATPVEAIDALVGKLSPYIIIGTVQAGIVIYLAWLLFELPVTGDVWALLLAAPLYSSANLILGFALSALAKSQIQAIQAAVFFYLPSMLLSGFIFPFLGMPRWAQARRNVAPHAFPANGFERKTSGSFQPHTWRRVTRRRRPDRKQRRSCARRAKLSSPLGTILTRVARFWLLASRSTGGAEDVGQSYQSGDFLIPEVSAFVIGRYGRFEVGERAAFPQSLVGFTPSGDRLHRSRVRPRIGSPARPRRAGAARPSCRVASRDRINALTYLGTRHQAKTPQPTWVTKMQTQLTPVSQPYSKTLGCSAQALISMDFSRTSRDMPPPY